MNPINQSLRYILSDHNFKPGKSLDKKELINSGLPTNLETDLNDCKKRENKGDKKKKVETVSKESNKQYKNNTKQSENLLLIKKKMNII